jgi:hypothetical protein
LLLLLLLSDSDRKKYTFGALLLAFCASRLRILFSQSLTSFLCALAETRMKRAPLRDE